MNYNRIIQRIGEEGLFRYLEEGYNQLGSVDLWVTTAGVSTILSPITRAEVIENDEKVKELYSSESIDIDPPSDYPTPFQRVSGTHSIDTGFTAKYPDGKLLGPYAISFSKNNQPILEAELARRDVLEDELIDTPLTQVINGTVLKTVNPVSINADVVPFVHKYSTSYSHWLLKTLPRVKGIQQYAETEQHHPLVLVPSDPPSFILESLTALGISEEDILEWDGGYKEYDNLIVPTNHSIENKRSIISYKINYDLSYKIVSKASCNWLREELVPTDLDTSNKKIYVSRADADRRSVSNETEVRDVLKDMGFTVIVPGTLSFSEQVQQFADADVIVGPHGAGLANSVFASDASIIEIFGDKIKPTYYMLSESLGHSYEYIISNNTGDRIEVNTDTLVQAIRQSL